MNREGKGQIIDQLKEKFAASSSFYITDASTLTVEQVNNLRRICFNKGIELLVAKNTLIRKALEATEGDFSGVYDHLHGPTSIMFCEVANEPAKVLKEFRKKNKKPELKVAYIDSSIFAGDDKIEVLTKLKSKDELLAELLGAIASPPKNLLSALSSSGSKLAGVLKTLSEKN